MPEAERRIAWRPWVRSLHRDAGYLAVGLTLVYAISGLAVNHIPDWDPNFSEYRSVHQVGSLPADDAAAARMVLDQLHIPEAATGVRRWAPDQLDITLRDRRLHVNPQTGRVVEEGHRPRFFLRIANWLHVNRGKKARRVFADAYAAGLLFLALSGIFMLPGKKGIAGRGAILVGIGVAIPLLYVWLSGGP